MNCKTVRSIAVIFFFTACYFNVHAQQKSPAVIAYYAGDAAALDSFNMNGITHLIYCFGHLKGAQFHLSSLDDTLLIQKMVAKKKVNPKLQVLLSLGGWGGCKTCSEVFGSTKGRADFAKSVKKILLFFNADGIDLDWEYPTIEGYPEHRFSPEDKPAFTALLNELRNTLGSTKIITFAAGGFQKYLEASVDWTAVARNVDYINLMTYDLVNGNSTATGHLTPLYSTATQTESTDNCVQYLLKKGINPGKLIIGATFYGRVWEGVPADNNGLYQSGKFKDFIGYKSFEERFAANGGYTVYWDSTAKAPYAYNPTQKLFATFDDKQSMKLKTEYVLQHKLGGIMFWQLSDDTFKDGLLQTIDQTLQRSTSK